jgi:hypothetical protein
MKLVSALVAAAATLGLFAPSQALAAPADCPSTFAVLHDDRIGELAVPQGSYRLTVLDPSRLSCAAASDALRRFLEDFDGRLPAPWRLDAPTATFTGANGAAFQIAAVPAPAGGGGGQHPAAGTRCPGVVRVMHDNWIGGFDVPAGDYTLTLLSVGPLSCAQAIDSFFGFLLDFDGRLPSPWMLDPVTGTFLKGSSWVGFRVEPAVNPTPGTATPPTGRRCAGTFRVLHNDRIGALRVPKGRCTITLGSSGRPTCAAASKALTRFLQAPGGKLPRPWRLDVARAAFTTPGGSAFSIKPTR